MTNSCYPTIGYGYPVKNFLSLLCFSFIFSPNNCTYKARMHSASRYYGAGFCANLIALRMVSRLQRFLIFYGI
jgi:hypothetical protein